MPGFDPQPAMPETQLLQQALQPGTFAIEGGEILIDGETINDVDARDRDVAMVFQSYALYPNMTIYENIRFPLRMRGVPKDKHDQMVREAAAIVELGDLLDRKPRALSGGQRQRAALARAVVRHPRVFLMDEPLSNLDAKLRIEMRQEIRLLQRELGITTLYVTHDQEEALAVSDRIAVLDRGRLLQVDEPRRVYEQPSHLFVADFIGGANKIPARAEGGAARLSGGEMLPLPVTAAAGSELVATLRAEDIRLESPSPDAVRLRARVVLASYLGAKLRLACALADGTPVEADTDVASRLPGPGGEVDLWFAPGKARVFDAGDGRRVG